VNLPDPEQLFRYHVISLVVARMRGGQARGDAVKEVARLDLFVPGYRARRVSTRTIYRWLSEFDRSGFDGLARAPRKKLDSSRVLDQKLVDFLMAQKNADPRASIPEIIRRAVQHDLLADSSAVDRTTVYRTLGRLGISTQREKKPKHHDARRFAYSHRLDMVLCDGKHFRAGATRARRVSLHFIDDATRFVLHVVVSTSENASVFQRGLYELVKKYGLMDILYLDRGPGFIARETSAAVANLPSHLLFGEVAYPQGHGKIERFNQTALNALLRGWDGRREIDPDCRALELRLQHYAREDYNHSPHNSLGGDSPFARFHADKKPLRFPDSDAELKAKFEIAYSRRVSTDNVVSLDSTAYEMPLGYAGQIITVHKKLLERTVHFLHQGRFIRLHPVDLEVNARSPRGQRPSSIPEADQRILPPSAADMAFDRDFGPVVDEEGGLRFDPQPPEEETLP